jgi:hypothetical protein
MEALKELVAASFARHGIECPASDSKFMWRGRPLPLHAGTTAAPGCPGEHSSAAAGSEFTLAQSARPTALPDHNFRKSLQDDPAP